MSDATRPDPNHPAPSHEVEVGMGLAIAQFIVTGILLGVVATLAYLAGMRSAGKEAGGTGGQPAGAGGTAAAVDVATLLRSSPELVAKGKTLFTVNCASCHGVAGKGDGPAAAALNPKPRDFTGTYWRYGGGVARIVQTISTGSPGTAMASFIMIPLEDRFALAHYVRTFGTKPEEDKPQDLAWLGPVGSAPGGAGAVPGAGGPAKPGPSIPVELAVRLLAEPSPLIGSPAAASAPAGAGADLYAARCASCHGTAGEGGVRVRMLGSSPYVYVTTPSLAASRLGWASDAARFEKLILEGLSGYVMPGNGDLTRGEIGDLYQYTLKLRAYQESTPAVVAPPAPNVPTRS